jgi:hypothetical protein
MGTLFNVLMYCVAFGALLAMLSSLVGIAFWLLKLALETTSRILKLD